MIQWETVKHELMESLEKAVSGKNVKNKKGAPGLVQVQRTVTKKGTTFTQMFWVKPDEVKSTDVVLSGEENLKGKRKTVPDDKSNRTPKQENTNKKQAKANSSGSGNSSGVDNSAPQKHWATMKIPQAIKDAANKHHSQFKNNDEFLKDLKDKGIKWNEHTHKGINLMRAKMALNAAIMNESHGFKSPFNSSSDQSSQQQTSDQSSQKGTQQSSPASQSAKKDNQVSQTSQPKQSSAKTTSKSKKKTNDFFLTCKDREEFYSRLKALCVQWTENAHEGINFMRAKMALSLKIENGFDPNNPPASDEQIAQANGINISTQEVPTKNSNDVKEAQTLQQEIKTSDGTKSDEISIEDKGKSNEPQSQEKMSESKKKSKSKDSNSNKAQRNPNTKQEKSSNKGEVEKPTSSSELSDSKELETKKDISEDTLNEVLGKKN